MTAKTGELKVGQFLLLDATGELADADVLPTATLVVDGVDTAEVVTVTNEGTGKYKRSCTMPALTPGQTVQVRVLATIAGRTTSEIVWSDTTDTVLPSDLQGGDGDTLETLSAQIGAIPVAGAPELT